MLFITNKKAHYFTVLCAVNRSHLKDCKVHESTKAMYQHVMTECGLQLDEVSGNEMIITLGKIVLDSRGCSGGEVITNVADYINNFEL